MIVLHNCNRLAYGRRTQRTSTTSPSFAETYRVEVFRFLFAKTWHTEVGSPVFMIQTREDLNAVPLEQFERPIAVEFVDVRSANDGLVRKYRYMQIGNTGVSHSLQISKHWEVRSGARLLNDRTIAEEVEYAAQPDPNQEILRKASRLLGLDFLAFDYSYDVNGRLIVWEVNVLPGLGLPKGPQREHLKIPVERAMASTVRMYLRRAGCEIPFRVQEIINFGSQNPVAA